MAARRRGRGSAPAFAGWRIHVQMVRDEIARGRWEGPCHWNLATDGPCAFCRRLQKKMRKRVA